MTRANSNLDLSGAYISSSTELEEDGQARAAPSIDLPKQSATDVCRFSLDIGGSLIKLVYFSQESTDSSAPSGGRLQFKKWETTQIQDCLDYIKERRLHLGDRDIESCVRATGGGAFKFSEEFKKQLGLVLTKEDEMKCLVAGCNFLLRTISDEAFTFKEGVKSFPRVISTNDDTMYPYLLVNIGSGVSLLKVDGEDSFQRISGTNIGGGTFWGLCRLLTGIVSFDEMLELTQDGADNTTVDMLVGDIYGGSDYTAVGLAATTIASSFGKVVMCDKQLSDYRPADIALSLLRMISYNIAHVAVLNAMNYGLKKIYFGGFFIRDHAYTMSTISYAINFWSKGELTALFLRHEGFLGALGAFLQYQDPDMAENFASSNKGSWVEKFIRVSTTFSSLAVSNSNSSGELVELMEEGAPPSVQKSFEDQKPGPEPEARGDAKSEAAEQASPTPCTLAAVGRSGSAFSVPPSSGPTPSPTSLPVQVGVLHLVPSLVPFPQLCKSTPYILDTFDITEKEERDYWIPVLQKSLPNLVERAVSSNGSTEDAQQRGKFFQRMFGGHLESLKRDPNLYGRCSLAQLLEFREECLREHGFQDAYHEEKERENNAAMEALPDLLAELDQMKKEERLLALVEGMMAGNIFDWGSQACVRLYENGTILDIYRKARSEIRRPWRVDDFDLLKTYLLGKVHGHYKKAVMIIDNSGADAVLGIIPFVRELLRDGTKVVLAANSLPAINDITWRELVTVVQRAAIHCDILRQAFAQGQLIIVGNGCGSPCIDLRRVSRELARAAQGADLVLLEGMGRAIHTNLYAAFDCDVIKLAMIKNDRIAKKLFGGNIYDVICSFVPKPREEGPNEILGSLGNWLPMFSRCTQPNLSSDVVTTSRP